MDSFNAIYVMFVFGVKYRLGLISDKWRDELYAVIGRVASDCDCVPLAIGGMNDHVHVLLSVGGNAPEFKAIMQRIKGVSSRWVNTHKLCVGKFGWQNGGGKFTYSYRELPMMTNYVRNQERHHRGMDFREEMKMFLSAAGIEAGEEYLPENPE